MRKLLLLAMASLATACADNTSPADSVLVTASASRAAIAPGEPVSITLTIHNRGDEDIAVALSDCPPPFEILDASGSVVGPASQACTLSIVAPITIAAGSAAEYSTSWAGESSAMDGVSPVYLAPGDYEIRPRVPVEGAFVYGSNLAITITQ